MSSESQEFELFSKSQSSQDLDPVLDKIHAQIRAERPTIAATALKLFAIHVVSSVLTLTVCPQFGFRLFFQGHGLMEFFMRAGSQGCFLFCGGFYLGTSFLLARFLLDYDSWVLIRKVRVLFAGVLALVSMGVLSMLGSALSFELGLMWFLGTYLGAWLASLPSPARFKAR